MTEVLYHPEVFMPKWFTMPTERATLRYSHHALSALNNDRYGAIPQFESLPLCRFNLVELGVVKPKVNQLGMPARPARVSKIVVRGHFDSTRDIVFVLVPTGEGNYNVKTCWFNLRTDTHKTLRRERYEKS